jgi:hypothetical protein
MEYNNDEIYTVKNADLSFMPYNVDRDVKAFAVENDNPFFTTRDGVLFNMNTTALMAYPPNYDEKLYEIPKKVEYIEAYAFANTGIKEVELSSNTTHAEKAAFSGCVNLKRVKGLENLKYIEDEAFLGCKSLKEIALGPEIEKVGRGAFAHCSNLESVSIAANPISFGSEVFHNCNNLKEIRVASEQTKDLIEKNAFIPENCKVVIDDILHQNFKGLGERYLADENIREFSNNSPTDIEPKDLKELNVTVPTDDLR